jgi:hypothetical protein
MIQIGLGDLIKITLRIDAWNNHQPKKNKRFATKPHRSFFGASSQPCNTFSKAGAPTFENLALRRLGDREAAVPTFSPL